MNSDNRKVYMDGYLDAVEKQIGTKQLLKEWNHYYNLALNNYSEWESNELELEMRLIRERRRQEGGYL